MDKHSRVPAAQSGPAVLELNSNCQADPAHSPAPRTILRYAIPVLLGAALLVRVSPVTAEQAGLAASQPETAWTEKPADKWDVLRALPTLGQSLQSDIRILHRITGYTFDPGQPDVLPNGEKRYRQVAPLFKTNPIFINGSIEYRLDQAGKYCAWLGLVFNQKNVCITTQDIESILGNPTVIDRKGGTHGRGLGPSDIWSVVYVHSHGRRSIFAFSTSLCLNDLSQFPER